MRVIDHIKILSEMEKSDRKVYIDHLEIKNYGSNELTETDMWVLTNASQNVEYLDSKLKEADELSMDSEAPEEVSITPEVDLDAPAADSGEELSLDAPAADSGEELSLDAPAADSGEELSLDAPAADSGEELSLDAPAADSGEAEEKKEIETSKEGIGILALLGEIQEKLANGKPSEVELAALKALKKLVG